MPSCHLCEEFERERVVAGPTLLRLVGLAQIRLRFVKGKLHNSGERGK